MGQGSGRRRRHQHKPGWTGLREDLRSFRSRSLRAEHAGQRRWVVLLIALGAVLRAWRMAGAITYDEALTYVNYAGHTFDFLFSDYTSTGNHILYSACARASTLIFGIHPWALRLPALLAGVLVLPLAYIFARLVFNRYIALIFLGLLAVSGPLVEYSALARGYSLVWLFFIAALLAARHFAKAENAVSAALLALSCALGMLASGDMLYPALLCYGWTGFLLVHNYESTVRRRVLKLAASFLLFIALTILLYSPVIVRHGLDQLIHHPSDVDKTWAYFVATQQDRAFDLWAYFIDTSSTALAVAGSIGVIYSAYISAKYRMLLGAMTLATVPVVVLQHAVAPPAAWTFCLFVFHLGSAIGLFYLLKLVHDKLAPGFDKPKRTLAAAGFVVLVFGWCGIRGGGDQVERFPEAGLAAAWLQANARPGDRICAIMPWDAPLRFALLCHHGEVQALDNGPAPGATTYILVGPGHGQTPRGVLLDCGLRLQGDPQLQQSWRRLELFSLP